MSDLRIFSYLPNPRIWKATIAARLCSVDVEVRGSSPTELASWRWDFDARPLTPDEHAASADVRAGTVGFKGSSLRKTAAFMIAHPFGTVPAAFSPDGKTGIFESNSIMRAVARLGERTFPLYGRDAYEASRPLVAFRGQRIEVERKARAVVMLHLLPHHLAHDVRAQVGR